MRQLLRRPQRAVSMDAAVTYMVDLLRIIGSPAYPMDANDVARRSRLALTRASSGNGVSRQLAAVLNDGDRSELLRHLRLPTLILHGNADPMVPIAHGLDLARKIRGARLERIEGWGHDLPDALSERLADCLASHVRAVNAASATSETSATGRGARDAAR
jgi:pimeloyl-ACP methyl ester carboxylesterase